VVSVRFGRTINGAGIADQGVHSGSFKLQRAMSRRLMPFLTAYTLETFLLNFEIQWLFIERLKLA
jgi:hypothetical protein